MTMPGVFQLDDGFNVVLVEFMERLGKATSSSLFNLVPRQLGEELLELECDMRRKYDEQMETKARQTERGESEEVAGRKDDKVEVGDLLDDIFIKEEKVEEELKVGMELDGGEGGGEECGEGGEGSEGGEGVEVGGEVRMAVKVLVDLEESKPERAIKDESGPLKGKRTKSRKPEKCDTCEKMFRRRSELQRHIRG